MRSWRLTPRARKSLVDIALWTIDTFGPAQADLYEIELLERCAAIASGRAPHRDCAILADEDEEISLRFTRAGEHFVVFLDDPEDIAIVDFLHSRSDLPARVAALRSMLER